MLDTDSGLVPGIPLPNMNKTIRIRVTRPFYYKGALQSVGSELDYPYGLALETIHIGKAERVVVTSVAEPVKAAEPNVELVELNQVVAPRRGRPPKVKE